MKAIETRPYIAKRILAGFIDYAVIIILFFIYLYNFNEPNAEGKTFLNEVSAVVFVILWGIITVGLEIGLGATLGNDLVGLKAIPESGELRKLNFNESFKRHVLDPIDMFFLGLIGVLLILKTDKNKRLGDIWAKTIVISNENV